MLLFIYCNHSTNTRKPVMTYILLQHPIRLYWGKRDFSILDALPLSMKYRADSPQHSSETKELAKKTQVLHLQAEEGTGKAGGAKACDFHTSSFDNPDTHLKHRCDVQVGRSGMSKRRRRGEGRSSFLLCSAPSPGMPSLHTPDLLGCSCLCRWIFAYRHFIYLIRSGVMNLMIMTPVTKFCGRCSGYRISGSEHQMAISQARSTGSGCSTTPVYGGRSLGNLSKD